MLNVRQEIKKFIEDKAKDNGVKNIKELNKDTQVSREIKVAILKAETRRTPNNLLSLTDYIVASIFGGGGLAMGGGLEAVGASAGAILVKRGILGNPKFKTAIAKKLMQLSDTEFKLVEAGLTRQSNPRALEIIKQIIEGAAKSVTTSEGREVLFQAERLQKIQND